MNPAESACAVIAGKLAKLPPFGPAVVKLLSISVDDESAPQSFEDAFMSDPALTAELLVLANSAAYGGRSRVQSISVAIRYLGLDRVRSIAATSALRSHTQRGQPDPYLASVWAHGIATAVAAEALGNAPAAARVFTPWGLPTTWDASACSSPVGRHTRRSYPKSSRTSSRQTRWSAICSA